MNLKNICFLTSRRFLLGNVCNGMLMVFIVVDAVILNGFMDKFDLEIYPPRIHIISFDQNIIHTWKCVRVPDLSKCNKASLINTVDLPLNYRLLNMRADFKMCPLKFTLWHQPHLIGFNEKLVELLATSTNFTPVFHTIESKYEKEHPGLNFETVVNGSFDGTMAPSANKYFDAMAHSIPYLVLDEKLFFKIVDRFRLNDSFLAVQNCTWLLWSAKVFLILYVALRNHLRKNKICLKLFFLHLLESMFSLSASSHKYPYTVGYLVSLFL